MVLAALIATGCQVTKQIPEPQPNVLPDETVWALETGDAFTLFTLEGSLGGQPRDAPTDDLVFHGYPIKQRLQIDDKEDRDELLQALFKGIAECDHPRAICFEPGFGIRATTGEDHVDLVICFECGGIDVFAKHGRDVVTTQSPLETFQQALKKTQEADNPLKSAKPAGF